MEQAGASYSGDRNPKWCSCCGNSLAAPQKVKQSYSDLAHSLLGVFPRELKTCWYKNFHMSVLSSVFCNSQKVETTFLLPDKQKAIYACDGTFFNHKGIEDFHG